MAEKALSDAGFRFVSPDAGIYIFVTHEKIKDAYEYTFKLLDDGVAVAPGSSFGGYDNFIRICLNQPDEVIEEAIEKMCACLEKV